MDEYFTVNKTGGYHTVSFEILRAFNDGALGRKFDGKLKIGESVSAAGTCGLLPRSEKISMSVEPMDGKFVISDNDLSAYSTFDEAVAAAKSSLISEFIG